MIKKVITTSLLILSSASVQGKDTIQIGFMSDYLFRGITYTHHDSTFYAKKNITVGNAYGALSFINISAPDRAEGAPFQMNMNFGYNNQFDGFNIDLEVISYNYLIDTTADETEFKIGTSLSKTFDIAVYRGIKNKTWYRELTYKKRLQNRLYIDASVGHWSKDSADDSTITTNLKLGRVFPEIYSIDVYAGIDYINDTTPFGNNLDKDIAEINYVFGLSKNF